MTKCNADDIYNIEKVIRLISKKHTCNILFTIKDEPIRFTHLVYEIRISPSALNDRLKNLLHLKLIEKSDDHYKLTEKGNKLVDLLEELLIFNE